MHLAEHAEAQKPPKTISVKDGGKGGVPGSTVRSVPLRIALRNRRSNAQLLCRINCHSRSPLDTLSPHVTPLTADSPCQPKKKKKKKKKGKPAG